MAAGEAAVLPLNEHQGLVTEGRKASAGRSVSPFPVSLKKEKVTTVLKLHIEKYDNIFGSKSNRFCLIAGTLPFTF